MAILNVRLLFAVFLTPHAKENKTIYFYMSSLLRLWITGQYLSMAFAGTVTKFIASSSVNK